MTRLTQTLTAVGLAVAAASAAAQPAPADRDADTVRVVVSFKPGTRLAHDARALMATLGGQVKVELPAQDAVAIVLPQHALARLRQHAAVAGVEEDAKRYRGMAMPARAPAQADRDEVPTPKREYTPYGIKKVQARLVPASTNAPIKVCIIDSGLDREHPDMIGNEMTGEYDRGTGNWYDVDDPHGTHVAGTIAALKNDVGVVGVNGAREVSLHIVRVFSDLIWTYSSTLADAANKCKAAGAKVINMSLGGPDASEVEQRAFDDLEQAGILSIASAGNGALSDYRYPASYNSVMSVAAVDQNNNRGWFSQYNDQVEIAAPGVAVLSDVPHGTGRDTRLRQGDTKYAARPTADSPTTAKPVKAALYDFDEGKVIDPAAAGKHCLIRTNPFGFGLGKRIKNCEDSGGVGAIAYSLNQERHPSERDKVVATIPSVDVSGPDGVALLAAVGQNAIISITANDYDTFSGTSMAAPHVSGVAARVWRHFPQCTGKQIRNALDQSALDLDAPGRDNLTGFGLVQARAAYDRLLAQGCGA